VVHLIHGLGVLFKEIDNHVLRDLVVFVYNQSREVHDFFCGRWDAEWDSKLGNRLRSLSQS